MSRRLVFTQLSLREQPLVYLAAAFIFGELIAGNFQILNLKFWFVGSGVLFCLLSLIFTRQKSLITAILLVNCAFCGGLLWTLNEAGVSPNRVKKIFENKIIQSDEPVEIWGVIAAAPELAPDRIYLDVTVEKITTLGKELSASGKIHLAIPFTDGLDRADYDALGLNYGTRLRALTNLRKASGYRNPGAPDFDELLEYRGYDATGVVKSPLLIERLNEAPHNRLLGFLYTIRANAIAVILRSLKQPTSGVLIAALFGNQYFLAKNTADSFRAGGTFHLLVISGLHVALLALVLMWLVSKIIRSRVGQFIIVIILLWGYALMVGAQPAITRSTVMLTVVLVGRLIFRTAPGANTVAASALALLVWQPRDLFNASFQLSFLTVLMIVLIAAPLLDRLKKIGEWRPTALTPYPPRAPHWLKWSAEILYWNEAEFREEMRNSPIRYRVEKSRLARWLSATRVRRFFQQIFAWTATTMISTAIVQIGLLPMMIAYFHRVSFVSLLTNVIQGALMFALMIVGVAYLLMSWIFAWLALKLAFVVNAIGWLTVHATDGLWRRWNFRAPDYGENSIWIYLGYFSLVLIFMIALSRWNPFRKPERENEGKRERGIARKLIYRSLFSHSLFLSLAAAALLTLFFLLVQHPFQHQFEMGRLSLTFLDVGQGDSILISFPQGKLMLLDAGGRIPIDVARAESDEVFVEDHISIGEAAVAPALWRCGIKRLDYIVASHGHSDHTQGFEDIGQSFTIGQAITGLIPANDFQFESFRQAAVLNRAPLVSWTRGQQLTIDGVRIEALAPFPKQMTALASANNQSLVLRLSYGNRSFLLTGDIEKEVEAQLVAETDNLKTDVLKVAHHGSRSSSTAEFLARVQPQYAIISVAHPSPFDHPHPEVMTRLTQIGAQILQTSQCGAITISTDGDDLQVKTFIKCE